MNIDNGNQVFAFDWVKDGFTIDRLIGSKDAHRYSIEDYPKEMQEKMVESARQIVVNIRRTWFKTGREADVVTECMMLLLHWGSIPFFMGLDLGILAKIKEPERFVEKPQDAIQCD